MKDTITDYPICQFNIVLGEHDKVFRSTKKNKYFIVSGNEDLKLVQYAVNSEYRKKKKEGYAVAGEIVFLIPDESYRESALYMMDQLNFYGSVKVVPSEKKEEVMPVSNEEEVIPQEVSDVQEEQLVPEQEEVVADETSKVKEDTFEVKKVSSVKNPEVNIEEAKNYSKSDNSSVDRVFHGDFEMPRQIVENSKRESKEKKKNTEEDISSYMWGDSKKSQIVSEKKHKIDLPVIIFVLSFLLLVGAGVILFILK